ncbi:MAG TPA: indole-3-glycerol phosphate synthase TrpC [Nitrospiria bacterium]|nr:indole-3-glycerol phosphate synthase TrpC [Nitrospiria bacterium]
MSLLTEILQRTRQSIEDRKARRPLRDLERMVNDAPPVRSFKDSFGPMFSIIGEVKRRSPSAGDMNQRNVGEAVGVYNASPIISAISVLTDEPFFGGSLERLQEIRNMTPKPILQKDFILDEYQVWEARAFGADAILLMGSIHFEQPLPNPQLWRRLYNLAKDLGMDSLIELGMGTSQTSIEQLVHHAPSKAPIWGINSRDFYKKAEHKGLVGRLERLVRVREDITVSRSAHKEFRKYIKPGKIAVAESGIHSPSEIKALVDDRYNAALIGTKFLKSDDISACVSSFAEYIAQLNPQEVQSPNYLVPSLAK